MVHGMLQCVVLSLSLVSCLAARGTWRNLPGLGPRLDHDFETLDGLGYEHDYVHEEASMGTTVLKYAAVVGHHVKSIDQHEKVEDLTCTSGKLLLHVGQESGIDLGFKPGDILVGSSAYGCHTDEPSGRDHGRHTEEGDEQGGGHGIIRRVQYVDFDQNGDVVVTTSPASHSDCFASSQIDFQYTPPHHGQDPLEAADKRHEVRGEEGKGKHFKKKEEKPLTQTIAALLTQLLPHRFGRTVEERNPRGNCSTWTLSWMLAGGTPQFPGLETWMSIVTWTSWSSLTFTRTCFQ